MSRALAGLAFATAASLATAARADHVPGHGASEAVRNLNTLGVGSGAALSRVMLLQEATRSHRNTLAPHSAYVTSLLGEYAPHPWFSAGVQLPLQIVDEVGKAPRAGLGNVRVLTRVTLHGDKLFHRVLSFGLNATFPTRTVLFSTDPGKTWVQAPYLVFTRSYHRAFWQLLTTAPIETRPAGTAIDLGLGAQGGRRFGHARANRAQRWRGGTFTPSAGLLATVRLASMCTHAHGPTRWCRDGRVTEVHRELGSTALYVTAAAAWGVTRWGSLVASLQVPVTPKRDFDIGGSFGLQAAF